MKWGRCRLESEDLPRAFIDGSEALSGGTPGKSHGI